MEIAEGKPPLTIETDNYSSPSISPAEMTKELVISKCNYFVDAQLWPTKVNLNPERWLSNFLPDEIEHAVQLLNSFMFFSDELTNRMFAASFHLLSNRIRGRGVSYQSAKITWNSFIDNVIVTPVRGEQPNISDSGFSFARKARQQLNLKEEQLMDQEACLRALIDGPRSVMFVDDFVGSGAQFRTTWERKIKLDRNTSVSFQDLAKARGSSFYYCPLVCTEMGYRYLLRYCPEVIISPVHILPSRYSALDPSSFLWPDHLRPSAISFLQKASQRAGIPDNNGKVDDWRGFRKLGLSIAFAHSIPDATLPILYWSKNGWKPLMRRT